MTRTLLPLVATVALGCSEALPPERVQAYGFAIDCGIPDVCTNEADSSLVLIFRWPQEAMPVRVWAEPAGDLPLIVREGLARWERALMYGEFRTRMVDSPAQADIRIRLSDPAVFAAVEGRDVLNCGGITPVDIASADTSMALPFDIQIRARLGANLTEIGTCYYTVVLHELGHAFGLLLHSGDPGDVMYATPTVSALSARDVTTFAELYHTPPTVRLPAGR